MSGFRLCSGPIDAAVEVAALAGSGRGACASFEGWVRDHNEGRQVSRLEYEAFGPLATREGERILAEARERFGIASASCVHRLGTLGIGDLAVWVGAASAHRAEAFAACRYIIDELKQRVPIWKKEHYAEGDSGWVGCGHCAKPAEARGNFDYARQTCLPEVGERGQAKLAAASVLVVGAGGLGCPALTILAGAGVGRLQVVDDDIVTSSNLHRQPLFTPEDIGRPKAAVAAQRLAAYNPGISVTGHEMRLNRDNAGGLLENADLVLDCSDNFATKFLVNDMATRAGKPAIIASVHQYEGQLQVVRPDRGGPCLRCLWPEATRDGVVGNCADSGVLGAVPATLGALQAMEALKILLGLPGQLQDEVLLLDLLSLQQQRLRATRAAACRGRACAVVAALESPVTERMLELDMPLTDAHAQGLRIADIREPWEVQLQPLPVPGVLHRPMAELLGDSPALPPGRWLLVCAHGVRSLHATEWLRKRGHPEVWSLRGGLAAQGGRS